MLPNSFQRLNRVQGLQNGSMNDNFPAVLDIMVDPYMNTLDSENYRGFTLEQPLRVVDNPTSFIDLEVVGTGINFVPNEYIPSNVPNHYVLPPLTNESFSGIFQDINEESNLAMKIFTGISFNFNQILEVDNIEERRKKTLKMIIVELLKNEKYDWSEIGLDKQLMSTMLSVFCTNLLTPISEIEMRTLILDNEGYHYSDNDRLFQGIDSKHLRNEEDFKQMLKNFTRNDLIFGNLNRNANHFDLPYFKIKRHFSLLQCFQHKIISYEIYMYFLIFFHKILICACKIQDELYEIGKKEIYFVNWNKIKNLANKDPKYLFFRFYPLYLKLIQDISTDHYMNIIRQNFKMGSSISIPSEMGGLLYMIFNPSEKSNMFFLDTQNPDWTNDFLERPYEGGQDDILNLIPDNINEGRQYIKAMNPKLLELLLKYFNTIKDLYKDLRGANFQIVFTFYSPFVNLTPTSRSHYVTASQTMDLNDFFVSVNPRNYTDFIFAIIQYIFLYIETYLIEKLLVYGKSLDSEEYNEYKKSITQFNVGNKIMQVLDPEFEYPQNLWQNLRIIGWKLTGIRSVEFNDEIIDRLNAFHQNNKQFQSWINKFCPTNESNCILQIIGNYFCNEKKMNNYNVSEVLLILQIELENKVYQELIRSVDNGRVYQFFKIWNKNYHHKFCLYIWASNSLLFKEYLNDSEITYDICVLYQTNIGVIDFKRYEIMQNYYKGNTMINLEFFSLQKSLNKEKKINSYAIYPKSKKLKVYSKNIIEQPLLDQDSHTFVKNQLLSDKKQKKKNKSIFNSNNGSAKKNLKRIQEISDVESDENRIKYSHLFKKSEFTLLENQSKKYIYKSKKFGKKIQKKFFNVETLKTKQKKNILCEDWNRQNIWGWDCETILNEDSNYYVRCLCVYNGFSNEKYDFFGNNCLADFFKWLKNLLDVSKNKKIYFYSFNGARFDNILIFTSMLYFFMGEVQFVGTPINIKIMSIKNQIFFYDLRLILTRGSLNKLSLEILGEKKIDDFNIMDYVRDIIKFDQTKNKIIEYCFKDCELVWKLVNNLLDFLKDLFKKLKLEINEEKFNPFQPTISLLTLNVWKYLGDWNGKINGCKSIEEYEKIKESYKGGMCLPIKKRFISTKPNEFLYHYDINSSYPYIMQTCEMPISIKKYEIFNKGKKLNLYNELNLYEVHFEFNSNVLIPYIPIRIESGLLYPLSNYKEDKTYVWGHTLSLGTKFNHFKKITVYSQFEFYTNKIFQSYIDILWKEREKAKEEKKDVHSMWLKIFMNSLYGKFGQKQFEQIHILHASKIQEFLLQFDYEKSNNILEIKKTKILKNINIYAEDVPGEPFFMIKSHEDNRLDFIGSLNFISSYIASHARLNLVKGLIDVGFENIFYFDTDSIFTNKPLRSFLIGDSLGKWKIEEDNIIEAYFLAPKVYSYRTKNGKEDLHCKGIPLNYLNWNDFVEMYENKFFLYEKLGFLSHTNNQIKLIENIQKKIEIRDKKRKYDLQKNISKPFENYKEYKKYILDLNH